MLFSKDINYGDAGVTGVTGGASWNNRSEILEDTTTSARTISDSIPSHPLGLKPSGNQYFASGPIARQSLGNFGRLPDEMILQFLEYLEPYSLKVLGITCRFLYAFCHSDELWKPLFLESQATNPKQVTWRGSWRATLLEITPSQQAGVNCENVFSDVLHRPFACSHIVLEKYSSNIPQANNISRLETLTYEEFAQHWSNRPFILTKYIQAWPVLNEWSIEYLRNRYSSIKFRAEAVDWPFSTYLDYMTNSDDESPLYLFDRKFAEKMDIQVGHGQDSMYWPPECFGPDLFELLGQERPAHRWLIIGPKRSGSTFHKDPNATSAWNAVIEGSKYWIMFPPKTQVPGVYVSEDSSEVTSPLSIAEWLLEFHAEARRQPGCIEGICKTGEILHVPSGWWHLVVNLEDGIALTQNFVPESHLVDVLSFLRDKSDQVTGFKKNVEDSFDMFVQRLRNQYPELLTDALDEMERRSQGKKRKWEETIGSSKEVETEASGFSFGFGDSDEEIP